MAFKMTIDGVTYTAKASKSGHLFYPVIEFIGQTVSDNHWINSGQPTRSKAVTIAKNYIKNLAA